MIDVNVHNVIVIGVISLLTAMVVGIVLNKTGLKIPGSSS